MRGKVGNRKVDLVCSLLKWYIVGIGPVACGSALHLTRVRWSTDEALLSHRVTRWGSTQNGLVLAICWEQQTSMSVGAVAVGISLTVVRPSHDGR